MLILFMKVIITGLVLFISGILLFKKVTKTLYDIDILSILMMSSLFTIFMIYLPASTGLLGDRLHYEFGSSRAYSDVLDSQLDELIENHSYEVDGRRLEFDNGASVSVNGTYFTIGFLHHPDYKTTYSFKYKADFETTLKYVEIRRLHKEKDNY